MKSEYQVVNRRTEEKLGIFKTEAKAWKEIKKMEKKDEMWVYPYYGIQENR